MEGLKQQYLDELKRLSNLEYHDEIKIAELTENLNATRSDEVIKSSVEDLIAIPSESEGIPEHMCDVPFHNNSPPLDVSKDQIEDFSESNNEVSSIDEDSFSIVNIDYVEASPPDSELVSSEVMEIVIPENEDYRNKRIDIRYRRECEIKINELKENFNGMRIEINRKKENQSQGYREP
nr:hypothetical protein [Tanacetum cinerariifolium]